METVQKIALIFTILGGINTGLVGIFDYNLITSIFTSTTLIRIIYGIIGVSALVNIGILFSHFKSE